LCPERTVTAEGGAYFFESLEVEVAEFDNVEGLVAEDLAGVGLQDGVETFWQTELLSVLGRHFE